jgi:hypothetical protein
MARRLTDKNDIEHGVVAIVWLPFTLCQLFRCNDGTCLGGFTKTGKGIWMEIAACLALVAGIIMLLYFAGRTVLLLPKEAVITGKRAVPATVTFIATWFWLAGFRHVLGSG